MSKVVYKSEEGRKIVESIYRNILEKYLDFPFEKLYVATELGKTHVLKFGNKKNPPLLMLHGSTSNSATWLGSLSEFIDNFCIYCVDIPGEPGLSTPVRKPLSSEYPNEWLRSLLDSLDIEKTSFVTMSLGSWYALNFTIKNPERVCALSMITLPGIVPAKKSFILKAILFMMMGKTGQKLLNKSIFYKTEVPKEITEFQSVVCKYFKPLIEEIPMFSDAQLSSVSVPIQYFGGDRDVLLDSVKTAERLQKFLPCSSINILNDTGHVIIDQFSAIKKFLIEYSSYKYD